MLLQEQPIDPIAPPRTYRSGPGSFQSLAPAVVVVRTWRGHGTGFVIDGSGLILTNHHVVQGATYVDPKGPASYARIDLGELQASGRMKRIPEEVRGYVVAVDPNRDLALLKLDRLPEGLKRLTVVPMAEGDPPVGSECAMVGHPASGMLWTYSEGRVSSIGQSPGDLVDFLIPLLHASAVTRAEVEAALSSTQPFSILLSSCLANPGDSGGPLVDGEGRLIGVTFAVPGDVAERVLTYHIALSEVKAFLDGVGKDPILLIPEAWQLSPMITILQREIIVCEGPGTQQFLFDLDTDTPKELLEKKDYMSLITQRRFDAEVVVHTFPSRRIAHYDTDDDAKMDVILVDDDPDDRADRRYRLQDGKWRYETEIDAPFLDPSLCGRRSTAFQYFITKIGW